MSIIEQPGFLFLASCHHGELEQGQGSRGMGEGKASSGNQRNLNLASLCSLKGPKEAEVYSRLGLIRKQSKSMMDHFNKAYLQAGRAE